MVAEAAEYIASSDRKKRDGRCYSACCLLLIHVRFAVITMTGAYCMLGTLKGAEMYPYLTVYQGKHGQH